MKNVNIRLAQASDYRATEVLTREAFWNLYMPGCDEHFLLHEMRSHHDYCRELDFVVTVSDLVVGNIVYTQSKVQSLAGDVVGTLTFGPLAVHPEYQQQGIGALLIKHSIAKVAQLNIPAIIIFGFPKHYVKHGFVNGYRHGVGIDFERYHSGLLMYTLDEMVFRGQQWKYVESPVYAMNRDGLAEYDQTFPQKEKAWQPSQEEFWIASHAFLEV